MATVYLDSSIEGYRKFLAIKQLPTYRLCGHMAHFPDEYAGRLGATCDASAKAKPYEPIAGLFDYQRDIAAMALRKQKFAVFAECGLGKTLIMLEFARHAAAAIAEDRAILIVSPLMVIGQTIDEAQKFYGDSLPIEQLRAKDVPAWLARDGGEAKSRIAITNYEALREGLEPGRLGGLILDESSILKGFSSKWTQRIINIGAGIQYKLCLTGTPAPNDRIEYANHAVFLDQFPTTNAFLARYFVNRGQTNERWVLKPHALRPFYRSLSHWCIFLSNPAVYGWHDNCDTVPPINVHVHDIDLTSQQQDAVQKETNELFATTFGGIGSRAALGQLAKGRHRGGRIATNKPAYIKQLVEQWSERESTIIWCLYNDEQRSIDEQFPGVASIYGSTPEEDRIRLIDKFKRGETRVLISKPKILGFGLNLQICTRQVFSGLQDSYESFHQAVKRSNRIGSSKPLNVHIPVTELEYPMIETVLSKANRVQQDTEEQERLFADASFGRDDMQVA